MLVVILFLVTIFLAYANGANDNFKGVATLYGSGTLGYRSALALATIATFAGSLTAIRVAQGLVKSFSGKGLVPPEVAGSVIFLIAVGVGAAGTVLLATRFGFPVSTTHGLVGGLVGAGLVAAHGQVDVGRLGGTFLIPLLVSPFIAFALGLILYGFFTRARRRLGLTKESCLCVGQQEVCLPANALAAAGVGAALPGGPVSPRVVVAATDACAEMYTGRVLGISAQQILDTGHILSAVAVSFARGLHDTPKIAGLLVAAQVSDTRLGLIAIASGMAIGGLLGARRVAETMSKRITELNHGQGFSANLVTSFLVIVASRFGVPVSTTHVSVGSIFGIGVVSGRQDSGLVRQIIFSWVITLPLAMLLAALAWLALAPFGT